MLLGRWEQQLVTGQHLNLPREARAPFGDGAVLTKGLDGGLWLFPADRWQELADHLSTLPLLKSARRQMERFLFADACFCQLDDHGMITIPPSLRDWAGIEAQVVILGLNSYLELWAPGRWVEREVVVDAEASEAAAVLGSLSF